MPTSESEQRCACGRPSNMPTDLTDPTSPAVQTALQWSCDLCQAPKGILCRNTMTRRGQRVHLPLPNRLVHYARLVDRRREPKEDA